MKDLELHLKTQLTEAFIDSLRILSTSVKIHNNRQGFIITKVILKKAGPAEWIQVIEE